MTRNRQSTVAGTWRITEMEVWDQDYCDIEVLAHITIGSDLGGEFQFGTVSGQLDGRVETSSGETRFEFSWSGFAEMDPVSGRGWLRILGNTAGGRLYFHMGDDSGLTAERRR